MAPEQNMPDDHGSHDHGHDSHDHDNPRRDQKRRDDTPPKNLAEQLVAPTLRGRESKCDAGCGKDGVCGSGGSCGTGGCGVGSIVDLVQIEFPYNDERRIVEVRYKGARREFVDVADRETPLRVNDLVLVETERGVDAGFVSMTGSLVHAKRKAKQIANETLSTLYRRATAEDAERYNRNRASEIEAMSVCRSRIESFALPMKLVDAEWQFDHHRVTFFFTAEGRVDFRELVRDLAAIFRTRIELRQISVRDEAKRVGGLGVCGRELCCTTHLGRYEHITLDHAKSQMLQINPTKLSGQCGRLKCCLLYEVDTYVEGLRRFPPLESMVMTTMGEGRVQKIDIFRDILYLFHQSVERWETISLEALNALPPADQLRREQMDAAVAAAADTRRKR